jgi:alkanesulfonate monooxygenase SsuD/methylene tetrahydromethanopterin reductase-like flavin-dependent oxidoreductase (luciferase family)
MAASTTRVRIGLLVGAIVSRPPTLFAKQAHAVDHASGGRLEVGLGAGGAPTDQPMWGVEDWSAGERAARFGEYVQLVDLLLRSPVVTFSGRWYATEGATMEPSCLQRPRPPLVLAAHGAKTIATAARYADTWNTYGPSLEDARRSSQALDAACEAIGRDPTTIRRSALLGLTDGTAWTSAGAFESLVHDWAAVGFTDFTFYDPPYARAGVPVAAPDVTAELMTDVIPRLRRELERRHEVG